MKLRFRFGAAAILTASLALGGCFGGQEEDQTENAADSAPKSRAA